jgi:hypothetical protein
MKIPKWKSHKLVEAFKIVGMSPGVPKGWLLVGDFGISAEVGDDYDRKHAPKIGGYYVRYEGGYESFWLAGPFESGYTRVEDRQAPVECSPAQPV